MKLKKISLCLFSIFLMACGTISVSASDLNWPIQIQADDETTPVNEEVAPTLSPTEANKEGELSPIDNENVELKDKEIFGEDYDLVNRLTKDAKPNSELSDAEKIYSNYSDVVPVVTTDQMVEWILKKGNEIISILQIFAQPLAIIWFIVSCAVCLFGTLTKGNLAGKGLFGMVGAAILYAACLYAPVLVNSLSSFLATS